VTAGTAKVLMNETIDKILSELNEQAAKVPLEENCELAIDWFNGRRTPDANSFLKGAIHGLSLGSDASRIFRALVEATCFGSKKIVDRFIEQGIPVTGLIGVGGVAKKSPFVMQMMADVLEMPIKVHRSDQPSAMGAAMFAATVAGIYPTVEESMIKMGQGFDREFEPNRQRSELYVIRYQQYQELGEFIDQ
jgi:L-ribulokinase